MELKYEPTSFEITPNDWYSMPDYGRNNRAINALITLDWFPEEGEVLAWRNKLKKPINWQLRKAILKPDGQLNDITSKFRNMLKVRAQPPFDLNISIYGLPGEGKSKFLSKIAAFFRSLFPEHRLLTVSNIDETIEAIESVQGQRAFVMADENTRAVGKGKRTAETNLGNLFEQSRKFGVGLAILIKEWRKLYLCRYYFQMFGFNRKTGESRAIWYDDAMNSLGVVVFQEAGDEIWYEVFEQKKNTNYDGLQGSGGELHAFSSHDKEAIAAQLTEFIQNHNLLIKTKGDVESLMDTSKFKEVYPKNIPEKIRGDIAGLVMLDVRSMNEQKKKDKEVAVDQNIVDQIIDRIHNDLAYRDRTMGTSRLAAFIRGSCKDLIPPEAAKVYATFVHDKRQHLRITQTSEQKIALGEELSYERANNPEEELTGDVVLHLLELTCQYMEPYVDDEQDFKKFVERTQGMTVNQIATEWLGSYKNVRPINEAILRVQEGPLGTYGFEMAVCAWLTEQGYCEGSDFVHEGMYGHNSDIINHKDREVWSLKINTNELQAKNKQKLGDQHVKDAWTLGYALKQRVLVISELKFKKFHVSVWQNAEVPKATEIPSIPGETAGASAPARPPAPAFPPVPSPSAAPGIALSTASEPEAEGISKKKRKHKKGRGK